MILVLVSLVIYGEELYQAVSLLRNPGDTGAVYALASILQYVYAIGLLRAWELLGVERIFSVPEKDAEKSVPDEQTRN